MISVVIPLFNKAPHIGKAIESVLKQTIRPLEVIVVDDGSKDGGGEIAQGYASSGIRYFYQQNQGVSVARNRGVKLARGEFVAFLDADDWWLPRHIEVLQELINKCPRAKLFSTAYYMQRDNTIYRPRSSYEDGWMGAVEEFFADYAIGLSLVSSITACARRADLLAVGGFPVGVRRGEDIVCWIKLALNGEVAHAATPTAVYYQNSVNRSNQSKTIEVPGSIDYLSRLIESKSLGEFQNNGANLLFDRIAFYTAAGFGLNNSKDSIKQILMLAIRLRKYKLAVLLSILFFTPSGLLQFARELRHPKVRSPLNGGQ